MPRDAFMTPGYESRNHCREKKDDVEKLSMGPYRGRYLIGKDEEEAE